MKIFTLLRAKKLAEIMNKIALVLMSLWICLSIGCSEDESTKCIVDKLMYEDKGNPIEIDFQYNEKKQLTGIVQEGVESYFAEYHNGKLTKVIHNFNDTSEFTYSYSAFKIEITKKMLSDRFTSDVLMTIKLDSHSRIIEFERYGITDTFEWSGGNIVKSHFLQKGSPNSYESRITYDDKINPFNQAALIKLNPFLSSQNNIIHRENDMFPLTILNYELIYHQDYPVNYPVSTFFRIYPLHYCDIVYSNCN